MEDGSRGVKRRRPHKSLTPRSAPQRTYSVAVVATMSAGKSTLLNAMIGQRLLPARNEACTASVCRIEDRDGRSAFRGRRKVAGKWGRWRTPITAEILQRWNDCLNEEITIEGDIPSITNTPNGCRVVLIDTPGPNNASSEDHAKITERVISEADFSSVVFVVNASVAGVEDEYRLLSRLQQLYSSAHKKSRIIFVVNKIDLLDGEHGESVVETLNAVTAQLHHIGFKDPVVLPACSDLELGVRQLWAGKMPYRSDADKPLPPKDSRENVYECSSPSRLQARLRRQIERFLSQRKFYRSGFMLSPVLARAFRRVERNRNKDLTRILIGGRFFRKSDLESAEILSGIPVLEMLLQQDLNEFAKKNGGDKK